MTDTMFTRTALTEAAKHAGVTTDQARAILEAAGVTVQPEKRESGWYLTEDGEVARVKPNKHTGALILNIDGDVLLPHQPWPKLTPARVVPTTAAPVTLTEEQVGELWDRHSMTLSEEWGAFSNTERLEMVNVVNAALAQHAAHAEGEPIADAAKLIASAAKPIDVADVRVGDRVRVELRNGDEGTFTVTRVGRYGLVSRFNAYDFNAIRSVRLLHREEA